MKSQKSTVVIISVLVLIIVSLLVLSVFFERTLQRETAEQFNRQQLLLAEAEVASIQHYLSSAREELLHIAQFLSMAPGTIIDLRSITDVQFKDSGLVRKQVQVLDARGSAIFSRGNVHAAVPDENQMADSVKRLCPGDVVIRQDTTVLSLAAPVCRYDSFRGAVLLSINIQDIARTYLSPLTTGTRGYAWMMDEKGNLLYHPTQSNMVGRNLYKTDTSCFKCHTSFDVEKKIIEGKGDYYGRQVAPTGEDKILAFSTATVGDSRWIIAISAPYSEITRSVKRSMKVYSWIILVIFVTAVAVSAVVLVSARKREKAEERANYERELEMMHAEKLASLERLTSGITSEIGNPLTSVFSFMRVLMDMEEDEFKKETLETIFLHVNRIEDILKQLSGFSRTPAELKPCSVNTIIEDSLSLIQYDKRVQDITIVKEFSSSLPLITTDGNQLSQVVVNLVLNAADAMPQGGTLTIRSRVMDAYITVDFADTGVGIGPKDLDRIFDLFYTTKDQGTGLGLSVCRTILQRLNGRIAVESEPNKGSRFTITLPTQ